MMGFDLVWGVGICVSCVLLRWDVVYLVYLVFCLCGVWVFLVVVYLLGLWADCLFLVVLFVD